MTTIRNIFQEFAPEYIERFGDNMLPEHRKVIKAITECKTIDSGLTIYQCTECDKFHHVYRSCGNRHCPNCQYHKSIEWLDRQIERQLPGHHFMITFTVPEEIRMFIRSNQREAYNAMFKASSEAIKKLVPNEKYVGGDIPGFFGVLHTWGRQMPYHPHIHYIAAGGAYSTQDGQWHASRIDFFLPVHALSQIYRAKFRDLMLNAGLFDKIPAQVWQIAWNVNIQAVNTAEQSIRYLAPYVFKVAISDHRIIKVEGRQVTISYKKPKSARARQLTLDVMEFMRRFLQHVLPSGFMKIRYYGFMSPNSSVSLDHIRGLIELQNAFAIQTPEPKSETKKIKTLYCPDCGGKLKYLDSILPFMMRPSMLPGTG